MNYLELHVLCLINLKNRMQSSEKNQLQNDTYVSMTPLSEKHNTQTFICIHRDTYILCRMYVCAYVSECVCTCVYFCA